MAIHKVLEVISQSDKSFDDAVRMAVADAAKTVKGINSLYVENFKADVKDGKVTNWRVNVKMTFEVKG